MKTKKLLSALTAVSLIAGAVPVMNASAVNNEPRVWINITYEDNKRPRADVMFENMPDCWAGDFHIDVGDGWNLVYRDGDKIDILTEGCKAQGNVVVGVERSYNYFALGFLAKQDQNFNGRFCSFYLEKNENFNSENAKINVIFENSGSFDDYITSKNTGYIIGSADYKPPVMLEAQEYIIGDANNDGYVNAIDGSWLLSSIDLNPQCKVEDIIYTYKEIFPQANCAAAPDANLDGIISQEDFDLIIEYYMDMSTNEQNNSRVGKREFYEIFQK